MPRPVIGLGAGGHARVVIDILRAGGEVEVIGLLDPRRDLLHQDLLGIPVLGGDDQLPRLYARGIRDAFLGVGGLANLSLRPRLFHTLLQAGFHVVPAIHPRAVISPAATLGAGVTVMPNAVINAGASIGDNVVVNTGAIIEHDCRIGPHCLIGPGAILAGGVTVEPGALIGMAAAIREGRRVGPHARVPAGALVRADVPGHAATHQTRPRPG